jgi:hypothetical protein
MSMYGNGDSLCDFCLQYSAGSCESCYGKGNDGLNEPKEASFELSRMLKPTGLLDTIVLHLREEIKTNCEIPHFGHYIPNCFNNSH